MGYEPAAFDEYAFRLFRFAADGDFKYPYKPWPTKATDGRRQVA
jgi:hypothetical protein